MAGFGEVDFLHSRDMIRNNTDGGAEIVALEEEINSHAADVWSAEGKVELLVVFESLNLLFCQHLVDCLLDFLVSRHRLFDLIELAVNTQAGRAASTQVEIGRTFFNCLLNQRFKSHEDYPSVQGSSVHEDQEQNLPGIKHF